jgi:hypothetical protein
MVDNLNCDFCQRTELDGKGYGFLPESEVQSIPFDRGIIEFFLLLDAHFLPEKKGFCGTQHKILKHLRKNKLMFVARPKLQMWLFPLLEVRPPPP